MRRASDWSERDEDEYWEAYWERMGGYDDPSWRDERDNGAPFVDDRDTGDREADPEPPAAAEAVDWSQVCDECMKPGRVPNRCDHVPAAAGQDDADVRQQLEATYLQVKPACYLCGHAYREATRAEIEAHLAEAHPAPADDDDLPF